MATAVNHLPLRNHLDQLERLAKCQKLVIDECGKSDSLKRESRISTKDEATLSKFWTDLRAKRPRSHTVSGATGDYPEKHRFSLGVNLAKHWPIFKRPHWCGQADYRIFHYRTRRYRITKGKVCCRTQTQPNSKAIEFCTIELKIYRIRHYRTRRYRILKLWHYRTRHFRTQRYRIYATEL